LEGDRALRPRAAERSSASCRSTWTTKVACFRSSTRTRLPESSSSCPATEPNSHRQGDAAAGFPGETYASVSSQVSLGESGSFCTTTSLDTGVVVEGALSLDGVANLVSGAIVNAPGAPAGAHYDAFINSWIGTGDTFLAHARFDAGGTTHDALLEIAHDPGMGMLGENFVVQVGDMLPRQSFAVNELGNLPASHDRNRVGQNATRSSRADRSRPTARSTSTERSQRWKARLRGYPARTGRISTMRAST